MDNFNSNKVLEAAVEAMRTSGKENRNIPTREHIDNPVARLMSAKYNRGELGINAEPPVQRRENDSQLLISGYCHEFRESKNGILIDISVDSEIGLFKVWAIDEACDYFRENLKTGDYIKLCASIIPCGYDIYVLSIVKSNILEHWHLTGEKIDLLQG